MTRTTDVAESTKRAIRDLVILAACGIAVMIVSVGFDLFNRIISWVYSHETWQLDEVFTLSAFLTLAAVVYSVRRWKELKREIRERLRLESEQRIMEPQLESALRELTTLRKLVPMCAWCKSIRDNTGYWMPLEVYLETFSGTEYTHGICPACARRVFERQRRPAAATTPAAVPSP
jgi:hypothetical protein